ncbi:hypothetical protein KKA14_10660 [bacterium]|nr:hypothetical protein [bacterium]
MKKTNFMRRFAYPLLLVIGINLLAGWIYDGASILNPGVFRDVIIGVFGLRLFISLWFFAFVGPPLAYYLGASFWERMVVAFANPVIWVISVEAKIACQFCAAEMIYFFFLPWTFGIISVTCIEFSISDLVCRFLHRRKRDDGVRIFHPGVIALLVVGLTGTYAGLIKGQEWVYFIVHHYKTNFLL